MTMGLIVIIEGASPISVVLLQFRLAGREAQDLPVGKAIVSERLLMAGLSHQPVRTEGSCWMKVMKERTLNPLVTTDNSLGSKAGFLSLSYKQANGKVTNSSVFKQRGQKIKTTRHSHFFPKYPH